MRSSRSGIVVRPDPYCDEYIIVQHENREYHIFEDGVVYGTDTDDDIPQLLFAIRDAYINYNKDK